MEQAKRVNPHHPPGPPLRALLKTLQLVIAPGGLPTGAGAASAPASGENSAREIARVALPGQGDVIGKRLSAAALHLRESLRGGGDRSNGSSGSNAQLAPNRDNDAEPPTYRPLDYIFHPSAEMPPSPAPASASAPEPPTDPLIEVISPSTLEHLVFGRELYMHQSPHSEPAHGSPEWRRVRDNWQAMLGIAAVRVMVRMQDWLALELGPAPGREGLGVPDYTLGSWDLKLVRHALATVMYILNTLCMAHNRRMTEYHTQSTLQLHARTNGTEVSSAAASTTQTAKKRPPSAPPAIKELLGALLSLLRPVSVPTGIPPAASSHQQPMDPETETGPTSARPPSRLNTTLALLVTPHMSPIILASLLVFYDPVRDAATYRLERAELLSTLNNIVPRVTLSALDGVHNLCRPAESSTPLEARANDTAQSAIEHDQPSSSTHNAVSDPASPSNAAKVNKGSGTNIRDDAEWQALYPPYVKSQTVRIISTQLLRPGGIRALLENTLPVDADAPTSAMGQSDVLVKARSIGTLIAKGPDMALVAVAAMPGRGRDGEAGAEGARAMYVRHCVREAQVVFASPSETPATSESIEEGREMGAQGKPAPRAWRVAMATAMLQLEAGKDGEVVRQALAGVLVEDCDVRNGRPDDSRDTLPQVPPTLRALARVRALSLLQGILQHSAPGPGFLKRVIDPILHSLMLLVSPTLPSPASADHTSNTASPAGPGTADATDRPYEQDLAKVARNVILLYTDLVEPLSGAEALCAACLINIQSGEWRCPASGREHAQATDGAHDAEPAVVGSGSGGGQAPNPAALTAWLDDVDRTQLLVHLAGKLSSISGDSANSSDTDRHAEGVLPGIEEGVMPDDLTALEVIRRAVLERVKGLRETTMAEG